MSTSSILYDVPGPRAKRRDLILNVVFTLVFLAILAFAVYAAYKKGIFDGRWSVLWDPPKNQTGADVWHSLLVRGLGATLLAAAVAAPMALVFGGLLAVVRRGARRRVVSGTSVVVTEFFRGLPVLLLMFLAKLVFGWSPFASVVFGLVVYNLAVVAEILRAGIAALPSGQREAGYSIGLSKMRTTLSIEMPQAVRIMLPALISQLVVLLKDTSLGFIVSYEELLRVIKSNRDYFGDKYLLPLFFVGAGVYIVINILISRLAILVERRMRRSKHVARTPSGEAPLAEGMAEAQRYTANTGYGTGQPPGP
jgi:glutamate transport system permease protein